MDKTRPSVNRNLLYHPKDLEASAWWYCQWLMQGGGWVGVTRVGSFTTELQSGHRLGFRVLTTLSSKAGVPNLSTICPTLVKFNNFPKGWIKGKIILSYYGQLYWRFKFRSGNDFEDIHLPLTSDDVTLVTGPQSRQGSPDPVMWSQIRCRDFLKPITGPWQQILLTAALEILHIHIRHVNRM